MPKKTGQKNNRRQKLVGPGGKPIGFVSLIFHEASAAKGRPHWIDAVYVEPSFRKSGVASTLIRAIEGKAAFLKIDALYALTEIPKLYKKNGWRVVEKILPADFIMHKALS